MKKFISLTVVLVLLMSAFMAVPFELGAAAPKEYASYKINSKLSTVEGDPRFNATMEFDASSNQTIIALFSNGENDWSHVDLSPYMGVDTPENTAVVSFYIKTPVAAEMKFCFFHTLDAEYRDSSVHTFTVNKADTWQLISVPMKEITYNGAKGSVFARFDLRYDAGVFNGGKITVSPVKVLESQPEEYVAAESFELAESTMPLKVNEFKRPKINYLSSKGDLVYPVPITWSSSDEEVVKVDEKGELLGVAEGSATITGVMGECFKSIEVIVSGTMVVETLAQFTFASNVLPVEGDPRFDTVMTFTSSGSEPRFALFSDGSTDWNAVDLSEHIGKDSGAYLYFYVNSPNKGKISTCFFHTQGEVYAETSRVTVEVKDANKWQAVLIPLSSFTYSAGEHLGFGRFDVMPQSGMISSTNGLKISAVKLLSAKPIVPNIVEAEKLTLDITEKEIPAESLLQLNPIFTSSQGAAASEAVSWQSNNKAVATVDENGLVKAYKPGKVTIRARSKENTRLSATCVLTVTERGEAKVCYQMWNSWVYTSNLSGSFASETVDPRFNLVFSGVRGMDEGFGVQFFQNGSGNTDIGGCLDFGVVRFWAKVPRNNTVFDMTLTCANYTATEHKRIKMEDCDGWQRIEIPLSEFVFPGSFDFTTMKYITLYSIPQDKLAEGEFNLGPGETIKIAGLEILTNSPNDPEAPIYPPVESITFENNYVTMTEGARYKLSHTILPAEADQSITYINRSNGGVELSPTGIILAKKPGTHTVEVITDQGKKKAECIIEVSAIDSNEESKLLFEANYMKGIWNDLQNGSIGNAVENLEESDPNYYRFQRIFKYSIKTPDDFYPYINMAHTLHYGSKAGSGSISFDNLNVEPYLETATMRFWVNASRPGLRIAIGFNDTSYNCAKYHYTIEKANEWIEVQIPLKDVLAAHPGINKNSIYCAIVSPAIDVPLDDPSLLKEGDEIKFGYIQVWSKEAVEPIYVPYDPTRYFYDDSDNNVYLADRTAVLPQASIVKFVFLEGDIAAEAKNTVAPNSVISTLNFYAINTKSGKKYSKDSLFNPVEAWIKADHTALKGADPTKLGVGIYENGKISLIPHSLKDGWLTFEMSSYNPFVLMQLSDADLAKAAAGEKLTWGEEKKSNININLPQNTPYQENISPAEEEAPKKTVTTVVKKVYKKKKAGDSFPIVPVAIGCGAAVIIAAGAVLFLIMAKRKKKLKGE